MRCHARGNPPDDPDWNDELVEAELNRRLDLARDEKNALLAKMWGITDGKNSEP
jgi:hypothetical protein